MTTRRRCVQAVAFTALPAVTRSIAVQTVGGVSRVGYLSNQSRATGEAYISGFFEGMRQRGYVEGKNLLLEFRGADGDLSRLPALAAELVAWRPDVLVVAAPPGVRAAMAATRTIPIVFATVSDPVAQGFVASLGRPGGNVTGIANQSEDIIPKHVELVRELLPLARRIALLINPTQTQALIFEPVAIAAAQRVGLRIVPLRQGSRAEIDKTYELLERDRPDALIVTLDPFLHSFRKITIDAVARLRLPAIYPAPLYSDDGGLISFGFDLRESFKRAATYVDKILKGAKPSDLPIEQPLKFEMVVNLNSARALGLAIPNVVLLRADRVIE